jgi:ubiquinone/menaquinone biosynthesis C-methylase UbiE
MSGFDDKLEAQKQWNADPCGASTAPEYERGSLAFFQKVEAERYDVYAPWLRRAIGFDAHRGQAVLEIGPGLGSDHAQFARAGAEMYALDLTTTHLELTRRRFKLEGLMTRLVRGDAEVLPFPDQSFDVVYSFGVLHHVAGTERAVEEIRRVLRPGGLAIVGLYHKHSAFYWICTMLLRGLLMGELRRNGYRRLLADVEQHSETSDAVPLVKVLTRGDCRRLFASFARTSIRTDQIDYAHFWPSLPPATGRPRRLLEALAHHWGWYLTVFAWK